MRETVAVAELIHRAFEVRIPPTRRRRSERDRQKAAMDRKRPMPPASNEWPLRSKAEAQTYGLTVTSLDKFASTREAAPPISWN
jgi:hypothetical protein